MNNKIYVVMCTDSNNTSYEFSGIYHYYKNKAEKEMAAIASQHKNLFLWIKAFKWI